MFTVTFYSYKGGVGRTSALMNVASRLCSLGKRVCLLDFDLEAPGLDSFGLPHPETPMAGVVEYISTFLENGRLPDFKDYAYEITGNNRGALFLIPAGKKDAEYQRCVSQLDWKFVYKQRHGSLIIEALKRLIDRDLKVDYFLIDSRTGLTDVSGIATLQLPDLVVLFFNLNDQNINGTAKVYRSIRENRLNRSIKTLLVASPIPEIPEFVKLRSSRFQKAATTIGSPAEVTIPYDPWVCFQESIVDPNHSRPLSNAYDILTSKIISLNEKDVINIVREARELLESGEMQLAELRYKEALELYPQSGEAWFQYGRFARIKGDFTTALEALNKSVQLLDINDVAIGELALTQLQTGDVASARAGYLKLVESSNNIELLNRLSKTLADKGEPELALRGMGRVIERNPSAELQAVKWRQAETLLRTERFEEASQVFHQLSRLNSQGLAITFNAGYAAWKAKENSWRELFQKATAIFEASDMASQVPRDAANIYSAIAFAYEVLGRSSEAIACLKRAIDVAKSLDGASTVFSFPEYEYVPKEAFLSALTARIREMQ